MSKRAEELATRILGLSFVRGSDPNAVRLYGQELAALIDAELRKERERIREKVCATCTYCCSGEDSEEGVEKCSTRAAILSEED